MIVVLLVLILFAILFPGVFRFLIGAAILFVVAAVFFGQAHAEDADALFTKEQRFKEECVDTESARYLGHGSIELAQQIADQCLSNSLRRFHQETTLDMVKRAERNAPNGVFVDLFGRIPGIGDASGIGGLLVIRASENFDCRSIHPGGQEVICNAPIDERFIEEGWPYWRDEFGKSRAEYDKIELKFILQDQERRRRLQQLAPPTEDPETTFLKRFKRN